MHDDRRSRDAETDHGRLLVQPECGHIGAPPQPGGAHVAAISFADPGESHRQSALEFAEQSDALCADQAVPQLPQRRTPLECGLVALVRLWDDAGELEFIGEWAARR